MIKVTDIEWDFDDVNIEECQDEIDELPAEVDVPGWVVEGCNNKDERLEAIEKYLSDEYYYCVNSFCIA